MIALVSLVAIYGVWLAIAGGVDRLFRSRRRRPPPAMVSLTDIEFARRRRRNRGR